MGIYTQAGDNSYSQIGDNSNVPSTYYKKMHFAYLDYEEKTVEIEENYQIDLNKLKYIFSSMNAYNNEKTYELGEIKYESLDEELILVNETGLITAKKDASGITKVKIEDITNGYETYLTVIVNRIENTDTVLYIYNVEDLIKFRNSVNTGDTYAGKTVYLMNDLDLKDICGGHIGSWTPIGDTSVNGELTFSGTFEGNNHSIDNLYIDRMSSYQGLFGSINNGKIMNLELKNGSISVGNVKTSSGAGAFAGAVTNGSIISCINKNVTISGGSRVGGIARFFIREINSKIFWK